MLGSGGLGGLPTLTLAPSGRTIRGVLYIYLFAAVAGGLLVLVSLASGGHHDNGGGDAGGDGVAHGDGAAHGDGVAHGHSDTPGNHDGDAAIGPGDGGLGAFGTAMGFFLSLQLWTYLLAFGGITGLLLRAVAKLPEPLTGLCAAGVGLGTALAARAILRRATGAVDSGTTATDKLAGATAKVLIPAAAGQTGKIRLESRGQTVDLLAHATDGAALTEGAEVLIVEVRDGIAEVSTMEGGDGSRALRASAAATSVNTTAR